MTAKSSPCTPANSPREQMLSVIRSLRGLDEIEALVASKLVSDAPLLTEIGGYLLGLGGKRMRPVLTLLCSRIFGIDAPTPAIRDVAAGIELIHMATLLHDDIIDKSPLRRHKESAYSKYGTENTLLAGDFLLTRAFSLCAKLDARIIDATEQACIELTEGEILEVPLYRASHDRSSSLRIARKKTAALFRLAALCAAHLSGAGAAATESMATFGEQLGIAFQILDDVLDVSADETLLGKRAGMDLRERKPSMVNILWLESGSALSRRLLAAPGAEDEAFVETALAELRNSAVVEQASALARDHTAAAEAALEQALLCAPKVNRRAVDDLRLIVEYTTSRKE